MMWTTRIFIHYSESTDLQLLWETVGQNLQMMNIYLKTQKFHSKVNTQEKCTTVNIKRHARTFMAILFIIQPKTGENPQNYSQQKKGKIYSSIFMQQKNEKNDSYIQQPKRISQTQSEDKEARYKSIYTQIVLYKIQIFIYGMKVKIVYDLTYMWHLKKPNSQKRVDWWLPGAGRNGEMLVKGYKLPVVR